jgi:UDP-N-acetylglucosamine--N-acetylmuramyl-(pentapeptide) pyrophosphoryl-undecaprenol N-acetylglucosamine transferase
MDGTYVRSDRPTVGLLTHGTAGAWTRAHALVRHLRSPVTVLSPCAAPQGLADLVPTVRLPLPDADRPGVIEPSAERGLGPAATAALAHWLEQERPAVVLVDGMPDAAMQARLAGATVIPLRRFARQDSPGYVSLRHAAAAWLAPYPAALEPHDTSPEVRSRTVHAGFLSRFEGRRTSRAAARRRLGIDREARHVTILAGPDGLGGDQHELAAVAAVARSWTFSVVGRFGRGDLGEVIDEPRVHVEGWLQDPFPHLAAADVIVCPASLGAVADVSVVRRPFAVITAAGGTPTPQAQRLGQALEETRAATALDRWPDALAWPALLAELLDQDTKALRRLTDGRGSRRAADWIDGWALSPPIDPASEAAVRDEEGVGDDRVRVLHEASEPAGVSSGRVDHLGAVAER